MTKAQKIDLINLLNDLILKETDKAFIDRILESKKLLVEEVTLIPIPNEIKELIKHLLNKAALTMGPEVTAFLDTFNTMNVKSADAVKAIDGLIPLLAKADKVKATTLINFFESNGK